MPDEFAVCCAALLPCGPKTQLEDRMQRATHGSKMISLHATVRPAYHEMNSRRKWVRPDNHKLWKTGPRRSNGVLGLLAC